MPKYECGRWAYGLHQLQRLGLKSRLPTDSFCNLAKVEIPKIFLSLFPITLYLFFFYFLFLLPCAALMTLPLRGRISFACSSPILLLQLLHCSLWMNSCSALSDHLSNPSLKACVLSLHLVSSGCLFDLSSCLLPARPNASSVTRCCSLHCFFIPGRWRAVPGLTSSPSHRGSFGPFLVLACW